MPADRAMLAQLVDAGMSTDEAHQAFDRVVAAARAVLEAGRPVALPDIGKLVATKRKAVYVPGTNRAKARHERKIIFRHGAYLEKGEPYDAQ